MPEQRIGDFDDAMSWFRAALDAAFTAWHAKHPGTNLRRMKITPPINEIAGIIIENACPDCVESFITMMLGGNVRRETFKNPAEFRALFSRALQRGAYNMMASGWIMKERFTNTINSIAQTLLDDAQGPGTKRTLN